MSQSPVNDARFRLGSALPIAEARHMRDEQVVLTIRLYRDAAGRYYIGHHPTNGGPGTLHEVEDEEAQRFFFDLDTWFATPADVFPELPAEIIDLRRRQRSA
jgi:hypothetical protein